MAGRNFRAVQAQEREFGKGKSKERSFPLSVVQGKDRDDDEMAKPQSRSKNTAAPTAQAVSLAEVKCLECEDTFVYPWGAYFVLGQVRAGVCSPECNKKRRERISMIDYVVPTATQTTLEEKP